MYTNFERKRNSTPKNPFFNSKRCKKGLTWAEVSKIGLQSPSIIFPIPSEILFKQKLALLVFFCRAYYRPKPGNHIVLLQLFKPIRERNRTLPICNEEVDHGTTLATCGMGSTSGNTDPNYPKTLQEAHFLESKLDKPFSIRNMGLKQVKKCREDVVCTYRVTQGSNICFKDYGNPLYLIDPCTQGSLPVCLYGVATYFESKQTFKDGQNQCNDGSYFAKITHFSPFIRRTMQPVSPSMYRPHYDTSEFPFNLYFPGYRQRNDDPWLPPVENPFDPYNIFHFIIGNL